MSERRVDSWALARMAASLARISLSEIPSWRSSVTRRRIVLASSRATRSEGSSKGVRSSSCVEDLPAEGLALLPLDPPLQGVLHRLAQLLQISEPDRVQERRVELRQPHLA